MPCRRMWSGGVAPRILNLGARQGWMVSFTPRPLYPQERALRYHWIWGCVGPRAGLDAVVKRKIPSLCWQSNPSRPARSTVAIPTEQLTPWSRVLAKLPVTQLVKKLNSLPFLEPKGSLPWSQQPTTGPYPEPDESSQKLKYMTQ
jgi:hypothetical protein